MKEDPEALKALFLKMEEENKVLYDKTQVLEQEKKDCMVKIEELELLKSAFEKKMTDFNLAFREQAQKTGHYYIFTHMLMIMLTWFAIPVFCYKTFGFSPTMAFASGLISYIILVLINQSFIDDIKKVKIVRSKEGDGTDNEETIE
jgi:hypothetical protein